MRSCFELERNCQVILIDCQRYQNPHIYMFPLRFWPDFCSAYQTKAWQYGSDNFSDESFLEQTRKNAELIVPVPKFDHKTIFHMNPFCTVCTFKSSAACRSSVYCISVSSGPAAGMWVQDVLCSHLYRKTIQLMVQASSKILYHVHYMHIVV